MGKRGNLRIYLGAATGVGTTYSMLSEAQRRRSRGAVVEVGCLTERDRPRTVALSAEVVGDAPVPTAHLDVDEMLRRRPNAVLVDDLAVDNPKGSRRAHRWQDVDVLLDAGIDVITTLDVQHIGPLADQVQHITGAVPDVVVPEEFLARVDQFEIVDIAPEAIRRRIAHGNVFGKYFDPAEAALFNTDAFARLRVLLLYWLADRLAATLPPDDLAEHGHSRSRVASSPQHASGRRGFRRRRREAGDQRSRPSTQSP